MSRILKKQNKLNCTESAINFVWVCVCAFSQVMKGVLRFCWNRRVVDVLMGILSLHCTVLRRSHTSGTFSLIHPAVF